jgi:subtilisin family serine protease
MRPVRSRFEAQQLERLEDRLAMSAEAVFDFYNTVETAAQTYQYNPFAAVTNAAHQQTGVTNVQNSYGFDGGRQTVAVIDTGIAYDHYALGRGYGANARVVGGWDFAENDADPYDDGPAGFHGTHVSGIIGSSDSKYSGVATGVDLVGLRVFNDQGAGKFEWVEQALRWVHEHRNDFENPITTVNLSLGTKWNSNTLPNWATMEDEFKLLHDDGIFISVAAGNDFASYKTPGLSYPAVSQYVVAVGSVTSSGIFSTFSQRADRILAAPGQSITSTLPDWFMGGNGVANDYGAASGTSMAAPYVAGAAVLVREAMQFVGYANVTQDTIYNQLRSTADVFYDSATNANYFRINVGRAIDSLMPADEAGGTAASAKQLGGLGADTTLSGIIGKKADVDVFGFTATVSGTITLDVSAGDKLAADVKIIGATAQTVGGKLTFEVTAGQQYSIQLGTKAGIGHYTVGVDVQAKAIPITPPVNAWGQVSWNQFNDLRIAGESWYTITAGRTGLLTIETLLGAGGNARVDVMNANEQVVASSNTAGNYGRLDTSVTAGASYLVKITGNAADADFRLANLVSQTGATVNVFGTAGNDTFTFTAGAEHLVAINGLSYRFQAAQAAAVNFSASGGNDAATLTGTTRGEAAVFTPESASLTGFGFRATVTGAAQVTFEGGGGSDSLSLTGTAGDDLFTIARNDATLVGGGFRVRGVNFSNVIANAGLGNDEARLLDTIGNDRFVAYSNSASLTGVGFSHTARGFDRVIATTSGGDDVAYLYDTTGDDQFTAAPRDATLSGVGYSNTARGFGRVFAYASQGSDTATLIDSTSNDLFYGRSNTSWMTNSSFYNSAAGFDRVVATATGGYDVAYLYDSAGDDVYFADPLRSTLRGQGFENAAASFDRVFAYSTTGNDAVQFTDSAGNDTFNSGVTSSSMSGAGYANTATNFRRVTATATHGIDQAFFQELGKGDSVQGEAAMLAITRAKLAEMVVGFDFVNAKATTAGVRSDVQAVDFLFYREGKW